MLKLYTPGTELTFGKYEGMTVEEICHKDPQYISWCHKNIDGFNVTSATANMVNNAIAETATAVGWYDDRGDYEDVDYDDPFIWDDPLNF